MTTTHFINARLIDPETGTDTLGDLWVSDGHIREARTTERDEQTAIIDCKGHALAPGIVDIGVKVCEPGERHKESYASAGRAAAAGPAPLSTRKRATALTSASASAVSA